MINQRSSLSWALPYGSQRSPIFAKNIVSTSQPLAAQAGVRILQAGGNAVDAAIATAITLTVVEPTSNGIGSDAFAIIYDGEKLIGLNASGRSPIDWSIDRLKQHHATMPELGWDSVTTPGAVSAWKALSDRFGKLPFAKLFESAIDYANNGFLVSPYIASKWQASKSRFQDFKHFNDTFFALDDIKPGVLIKLKDHGKTLDQIAKTAGESFYRGELADKIEQQAIKEGGDLRAKDLDQHQPLWVETISQSFEHYQLHELPPNGQGLATLIALGILRHRDIKRLPLMSVESLHLQLEAMKLAFKAVHQYVGDPDINEDWQFLLTDEILASLAESISMDQAQTPELIVKPNSGTVYLSTADQSGMMVSYIQSNYLGFGSGIVIEGTGISLQNRGAGFVFDLGHINEAAASKRPFHTIIPGFLMSGQTPVMSFGVMGGHMQPQGHLQVLLNTLIGNMNPQSALDAPRWHVHEDFSISLEPGFGATMLNALADKGHQIAINSDDALYGAGQIIYRLADGYCAGSEPRVDGCALGF